MKKNKVGIIIQARLSSKRFPNKVLKKIANYTIMEIILKRLERTKLPEKIIFSIPSNKRNKYLYNHLIKIKANVEVGSEDNVLKRFLLTAKKNNLNTIVRITGDCPLADPKLVDKFIKYFLNSKIDYLRTSPKTYPDGFDIEVFSIKVLEKVSRLARKKYDLEHVTSYIRNNKKKFSIEELEYFPHYNIDYSFLKLSLDDKKTFLDIKNVFDNFKNNIFFSIDDIFKENKFKKIFAKNLKDRNNLICKTKNGQSLWKRANITIAGGNMILSKSPDRFLPNFWPSYYKSATGCKITDYDGNIFTDMSLMGVGTNVLGYSNRIVDNAVKKILSKSNMSTLNCREEILLAEKIIFLHPWFDKLKFARTGGEANAIAVRLARAYTGKDKVAVCGYHGWHDWYLSANLNSNNNQLEKHLLKGLEIGGVPKDLSKSVFPFEYGNIDQLVKICSENSIGTIKMEVCRNTEPNISFLNKIRSFAKKNNMVLIFDECTTGFRETLGGLHTELPIKPDMCIFGKALGNGYAITAVAGKKEIMDCVKNTFISSTFWSERIGFVAALKTIEIMEKKKTGKKIRKIGEKIQDSWRNIFKKYSIDAKINGIPSLTNFVFKNNNLEYKTFITEQMLKKNILASNALYCSIAHTKNILSNYFDNLEIICEKIKKFEKYNNINDIIKTRLPIQDFKRLN
jgi:glutamate-1-semialdehyde 2,1-aminomutase